MGNDPLENFLETCSEKKQSRRDKSLTCDSGRGFWFVKNNKIYAKHKIGEVLKVDSSGKPKE